LENFAEFQDEISQKGNNKIFSNLCVSIVYLLQITGKKELRWDLVPFCQETNFKLPYYMQKNVYFDDNFLKLHF
jgi:hypothetical protein